MHDGIYAPRRYALKYAARFIRYALAAIYGERFFEVPLILHAACA